MPSPAERMRALVAGKPDPARAELLPEEREAARAERERQEADAQRRWHDEMQEQARQNRLLRAGIPKGRVGWTWATSPPSAAPYVERLQAVNARRGSALLLGSSGTGKTGLGVGAIQDAVEGGRTAAFVLLPLLLVDLNDCYRVEGISRGDLIRAYTGPESPDLLVIDDLGAELRDTEAVRGDVWLIIEMRQANDRPMIITTNCDAAELRRRYDDRTFSRLREFEKIEVNGDDQRGRRR